MDQPSGRLSFQARNRKQPHRDEQNSNSKQSSAASSLNHNEKSANNSSKSGNNGSATRKYVSLSSWYVAIGVASIAVVSYFVYFGYLVSFSFSTMLCLIFMNFRKRE